MILGPGDLIQLYQDDPDILFMVVNPELSSEEKSNIEKELRKGGFSVEFGKPSEHNSQGILVKTKQCYHEQAKRRIRRGINKANR